MTMEQTAVVAFPNHETAIAFGAEDHSRDILALTTHQARR
jgi:hypothetical protein